LKFFLSLQRQNEYFDYAAECGEQGLIDTTPFTNKESLHVALLLFSIAADKGAEEINIIQALSHNGYLFFPFIHKHFSRIGIQFKKPFIIFGKFRR
jgi:hypothetical protein